MSCERSRKGYGSACLAAIAELQAHRRRVVHRCRSRLPRGPKRRDCLTASPTGADLVIGSRALGGLEPGALSATQVFGNRLATALIRWLWRQRVTDLGPYRAIRTHALAALGMRDTTFGWTVEMQVKAIQQGMQVVEVPVDTRVTHRQVEDQRYRARRSRGRFRYPLDDRQAPLATTKPNRRGRGCPAPALPEGANENATAFSHRETESVRNPDGIGEGDEDEKRS